MNIHSCARSCPASRLLLVTRVLKDGWQVAEAAEAAGLSERTAYKWLRRFREGGQAALQDRSSRPRRCPHRTSDKLEALVVELRHQRMTAPAIAGRLKMPRSTVSRILVRHRLSRLKLLEPQPPARRYEHSKPGSLLHLDIKKLARFEQPGHRVTGDRRGQQRGHGWEFVHVCVDDYTRLAYVEILADEKGTTAAGFLRRALAWYRGLGIRVRRLLTDNGACYRSAAFRRARRHVRHSFTRPYRPQTNGKAERFIQTMLREWAYARPYANHRQRKKVLPLWLRRYNFNRPHGSLGRRPPASRLKRPRR